MQRVFVLSADRQPLDPCHPARARKLLKAGRAAVFRRYPFTIILRDRTAAESVTHPHRIKVDPGSKTSGFAVVQDETGDVVWAAELHHRGEQIKRRMLARRQLRRGRRNRKCRYRPPRFDNRASSRRRGRLPPSLQSRVENTATWVERLRRLCPVEALSLELAKFDTQKLENPEISGVEYQQGELAGYEVREYLLEKFERRCAYCGAESVPLQVEHIVPKGRGGSDRVSNLTISCQACNQKKGSRTASEFGHPEVEVQARRPLRDAAVLNATRWAVFRRLEATGLPLEVGTGGRTKYNRTRLGLQKAHWTDAACVGQSGADVLVPPGLVLLQIRATGHGRRQRCRTDRYGFPICHALRAKEFQGWQTGDLVKAAITKGKYSGVHVGRIAIRFRPAFRLNGIDVHPKYLELVQKADGYEYRQVRHSPAA
jgi:5-methylcytosine-specific restriction endonuclease McrA